MGDALWFATRSLRFHWRRAALLVAALAIVLGLPAVAARLNAHYAASLGARAAAVPLLLTRPGDTVDRVLAALYLRPGDLEPVPQGAAVALRAHAEVIPVHVRHTVRGRALVGTSPEYYALRGLRPEVGTAPLRLGEATLGAAAAEALGAGVGDRVLTDTPQTFDLAGAYPTRLRVVGVWAATGGPEDDAVFVDVGTAWIVDGLAHGHQPPSAPGALPPGTPTYQEVTPENAHTLHRHTPDDELPLTAAIVRPRDARAETLAVARHRRGPVRLVRPAEIVDDVLATMARVRAVLQRQLALVGLAALLLLGVVAGLDLRLRAESQATLHRLGCSRGRRAAWVATEWALIVGAAAALAAIAAWAAPWIAPGVEAWL